MSQLSRRRPPATSSQSSDKNLPAGSSAEDDLIGVLQVTAMGPTDPATKTTPVKGQCRVTPSGGNAIIIEVNGNVDWSTGTIRLSGHEVGADTANERTVPRNVEKRPQVSHKSLTNREREVATLLALGESNARIAEKLRISPHTARRHTERIMAKLGAKSRAQVGAILRGVRTGRH